MKLHANARTCPDSRRLLVARIEEKGWSVAAAAEAAGVTERTAYRWLRRFRSEGEVGLADRSSAPQSTPHAVPLERIELIAALRRLRMTAAQIAEVLEMAVSTVSGLLRRIGLGKRSRLEPPEPPNRYERRRVGELVHIDVKKLGRIERLGHRVSASRLGRKQGAGWEFVHVCVDDCSRLAYAEVLSDERAERAIGFLRRALEWFRARGVSVERVMTDNGSAYVSHAHRLACSELGIRHLRTRAYRPRTNGKAERFIQTLQNDWAYGRLYGRSAERTSALEPWLNHYNFTRPHGSLGHKPPGSRLTNVGGNYT